MPKNLDLSQPDPLKDDEDLSSSGVVAKRMEDHLCEDWRCVNPNHLDVCTNLENNRRYRKTRSSWTLRDSYGRFAGRREGA